MQFHIIINGKSVGPHTKEEVESMLEDGSLRPNDQIWHEDLEGWQSIEQVFEIKTVKSPPPVPLSPPPPPLPASASVRSTASGEIESPPSKEQTKTSKTTVLVLIAVVSGVALTFIGQGIFTTYQTKTDLKDDRDTIRENRESIAQHQAKTQQDLNDDRDTIRKNRESMAQRQAKIQQDLNDEVEALQRELQAREPVGAPASEPPMRQTPDVSATDRGKMAARESVGAPTSEPPMRQTPDASATDRGKIADRLKLIGPRILGIQLGDNVEQVCRNFNAEHAGNLNGQKMEVQKIASDGNFVCSTPDGIRAAAQIDGQMNQSADIQSGGDLAGTLLSGLFGGVQAVVQAQMTEAPIIYANKDGVITKYVFSGTAVATFFAKASLASNQEFAGFLRAKYGLPDLRPEVVEVRNPLSESTEYVPKYHGFSSEGYSVNIDERKGIFIEEL